MPRLLQYYKPNYLIMKKAILSVAVIAAMLTAGAQNNMQQTNSKKAMPKKEAAKGKEHVCNSSCTKQAHAYMHGEKGHTCTDACHKKK